MHPVLKAFYDAHADRFPDLKITRKGSRLILEWDCDEIFAFMFSGEDDHPSFEVDEDSSTQDSDHLAAAVEAFAFRLSDAEADEVDDVAGGRATPDAKPDTFGALVWTKAIDLRLAEMEEAADCLRAERARLNPTTVSDLPLFTEK